MQVRKLYNAISKEVSNWTTLDASLTADELHEQVLRFFLPSVFCIHGWENSFYAYTSNDSIVKIGQGQTSHFYIHREHRSDDQNS